MTTPLRAVIVDDSSIYRSILTRVLKQMPDVELVGTAANGVEALEIVARERMVLGNAWQLDTYPTVTTPGDWKQLRHSLDPDLVNLKVASHEPAL